MYLENTVSKPPTINFYFTSKNYKIYGFIALYALTSPNSVTAYKRGNFTIEFKDKDVYKVYIPPLLVSGLTLGKRVLNYFNYLIVQSINNNISSVIKINPDKKGKIASFLGLSQQKTFPDYSKGYIVDSNLITINKETCEIKTKVTEKDYKCEIEGEWTDFISFNKVRYWSEEDHSIPYLETINNYILPSDSTLRKDLIALQQKNEEESQKLKEEYEKVQREDRKLRLKYKKKDK